MQRARSEPAPELPLPPAGRLPKPRWLDARLLIGLLLILVSVVVGAKLYAEVDERVQVWAVARDLGANSALSDRDLVVRSVRLDGTARHYVSAEQDVDGLVLNRPVGRNELLPVAALSETSTANQRRVVIEVDRFGATGLSKGSVVDVYSVRASKSGEPPARPELVLEAVTVADELRSGSGGFGGSGSKTGLPLLVPGAEVTAVIDAVAQGTVYVVQVPAGAGARSSASP